MSVGERKGDPLSLLRADFPGAERRREKNEEEEGGGRKWEFGREGWCDFIIDGDEEEVGESVLANRFLKSKRKRKKSKWWDQNVVATWTIPH